MGPPAELIAAVPGNLFELEQSRAFVCSTCSAGGLATANPGPAFGVEGTRRRPVSRTGRWVRRYRQALVGLARRPPPRSSPSSPVRLDLREGRRVAGRRCRSVLLEERPRGDGGDRPRANRTGHRFMFAFDLTGEIDAIHRRHDLVLELGGTCVIADRARRRPGGLPGAAPPLPRPRSRSPQRLGHPIARPRRSASLVAGRKSDVLQAPTTCT